MIYYKLVRPCIRNGALKTSLERSIINYWTRGINHSKPKFDTEVKIDENSTAKPTNTETLEQQNSNCGTLVGPAEDKASFANQHNHLFLFSFLKSASSLSLRPVSPPYNFWKRAAKLLFMISWTFKPASVAQRSCLPFKTPFWNIFISHQDHTKFVHSLGTLYAFTGCTLCIHWVHFTRSLGT